VAKRSPDVIFGVSHIGLRRLRNEDAIYCDPLHRYALLCDGMGGHMAGSLASHSAIGYMASYLDENLPGLLRQDQAAVFECIQEGVRLSSEHLREIASVNSQAVDLGTTLALLLKIETNMYVCHIGDSRAFLYRDPFLYQLTFDHTLYNDQLLAGISPSEARRSPMAHALTQSLGQNAINSLGNVTKLKTQPNDIFMIASDGLYGKVQGKWMESLCSQADKKTPHKLTLSLCGLALEAGGEDNVSLVTFFVS
jgi:serine/threonine protein phosphatase PrpC